VDRLLESHASRSKQEVFALCTTSGIHRNNWSPTLPEGEGIQVFLWARSDLGQFQAKLLQMICIQRGRKSITSATLSEARLFSERAQDSGVQGHSVLRHRRLSVHVLTVRSLVCKKLTCDEALMTACVNIRQKLFCLGLTILKPN